MTSGVCIAACVTVLLAHQSYRPCIYLVMCSTAGLIAIGLSNEEYADEAVRTPLVQRACTYVRRCAQQLTQARGEGRASAASEATGTAPTPSPLAHMQFSASPGVVIVSGSTAAGEECGGMVHTDYNCLRQMRLVSCLRILTCTGEYIEALPPLLQERGLESCLCMLQCTLHTATPAPTTAAVAAVAGASQQSVAEQHSPHQAIVPMDGPFASELLSVVCSLLAHRRFAQLLLEEGGLQLLLDMPRQVVQAVLMMACTTCQ
jgi:hypothetical protein